MLLLHWLTLISLALAVILATVYVTLRFTLWHRSTNLPGFQTQLTTDPIDRSTNVQLIGFSDLTATDFDLQPNLVLPTTFVYTPDVLCPLRDQLACNSCFATALTAVLENRVALASNTTLRIPLSVQQILSCGQLRWDCSEGGDLVGATLYTDTQGLVPEKFFPYQPQSPPPICQFTTTNPYRVLSSTQRVPPGQTKLMQQLLYLRGPLLATFEYDSTLLRLGSGGVYRPTTSSNRFHTAELVGWREQHWIVRNSWGPKWPQGGNGDGLFYIPFGVARIEDFVLDLQVRVTQNDTQITLPRRQTTFETQLNPPRSRLEQWFPYFLVGTGSVTGTLALFALLTSSWFGLQLSTLQTSILFGGLLLIALTLVIIVAWVSDTTDTTDLDVQDAVQVFQSDTLQHRSQIVQGPLYWQDGLLSGTLPHLLDGTKVTVRAQNTVWAHETTALDTTLPITLGTNSLTLQASVSRPELFRQPDSLNVRAISRDTTTHELLTLTQAGTRWLDTSRRVWLETATTASFLEGDAAIEVKTNLVARTWSSCLPDAALLFTSTHIYWWSDETLHEPLALATSVSDEFLLAPWFGQPMIVQNTGSSWVWSNNTWQAGTFFNSLDGLSQLTALVSSRDRSNTLVVGRSATNLALVADLATDTRITLGSDVTWISGWAHRETDWALTAVLWRTAQNELFTQCSTHFLPRTIGDWDPVVRLTPSELGCVDPTTANLALGGTTHDRTGAPGPFAAVAVGPTVLWTDDTQQWRPLARASVTLVEN